MIKLTVEIDIDDNEKIGSWNRRIVVRVPNGYQALNVECTRWSRDLATGSVELGVAFRMKSPPDILPRISIYGDKK